jgi:hypothetical protein
MEMGRSKKKKREGRKKNRFNGFISLQYHTFATKKIKRRETPEGTFHDTAP